MVENTVCPFAGSEVLEIQTSNNISRDPLLPKVPFTTRISNIQRSYSKDPAPKICRWYVPCVLNEIAKDSGTENQRGGSYGKDCSKCGDHVLCRAETVR